MQNEDLQMPPSLSKAANIETMGSDAVIHVIHNFQFSKRFKQKQRCQEVHLVAKFQQKCSSACAACSGVRVDAWRLPCNVLPQIVHPVEEFVMDKDLLMKHGKRSGEALGILEGNKVSGLTVETR
ncbi:hypothetical protein U9M48_011453 [Paspalum notatum var. saurae]|uniref:Uncharacterized protein n=1 Tax=Paspalum notatum var. saurae TaxID=547442 RepID=A0AAQ3WHM8_PASNO